MTTLYQAEPTPTSAANRTDWLYIRSAASLLTSMVCCAFVLRIVVVAFSFLRIAAASLDHGQFGAEMGWVARSLALGHGFSSPFFPSTGPTALVPPLFPYLLAAVFRTFGLYTAKSAFLILSLDSLLSALTCIPIYLSLKYAAGERLARLAGWLWVIYPFAIYFSGAQVWDYALTSFLFATCFCLAQRLHLQETFLVWFGFGILYGVTALSNPSVLSMFPFLLLTALWKVNRVGGRWLLRGVVTVVAITLVLGPWAIRNDRVMHAMSPIRDGFWLEFWAGNSGDTFMSNPAWAHPASNPVEMQEFEAEGETAYFAHKHTLAVNFVRYHPLLFAGVSLRRAVRFWTGFWSFKPSYLQSEPLDVPNVFFCSCITLFMLRGISRWWREDRTHASPFLIMLLVFPVPYYLTHSSMDYRQPIEPQIVILVTIGLFGLRDWTASAHSQEVEDFRQHQPEPLMAYTFTGEALCQTRSSAVAPKMY
jgi:4-amino-4-deoxy-L-arabinose transferase-like glycosyltransferase